MGASQHKQHTIMIDVRAFMKEFQVVRELQWRLHGIIAEVNLQTAHSVSSSSRFTTGIDTDQTRETYTQESTTHWKSRVGRIRSWLQTHNVLPHRHVPKVFAGQSSHSYVHA